MDLLCDHALARRLERAEGYANAMFVEARAEIAPESGAAWTEVAGAYAMFDGPESPCTQTFCLGLFAMPEPADMERVEAFFKDRGAPVFHEVSPLADKRLLPLLNQRGYHPMELSTVMFMPIDTEAGGTAPPSVGVRLCGPEDRETWVRVCLEGWAGLAAPDDLMGDLMRGMAARRSTDLFLAEIDGEPVASGILAVHDGVALLAGASTVPAWRSRGAQRALLAARLARARQAGCDLAMVCAEPGSSSQRNAERQGFRVAYTRTKWQLG